MKTKKLTPNNAAPVKRENVATVPREGNAIAPCSILDEIRRLQVRGYVHL